MGGEPDVLLGQDVLDELLQHQDPAAVADILRVHSQDKESPFLVSLVELGCPDLEDLVRGDVRPDVAEALEPEIRIIVEKPLDRELDDSRRLSSFEDFLVTVVGHQDTVVEKPELPDELEGGGAEIPGRRADASRRLSSHLLERVE